jgi:Leucine-rich repeat (LRR) protein
MKGKNMQKNYQEIFQIIEKWNKKEIKKILKKNENNEELKNALSERYDAIINFIDGKNLSALPSVPNKIVSKKSLKKQWTPDETTISILNTIPIYDIRLYKIEDIPGWIAHLKQCEILFITECGLENLPEGIKEFKNLTELRLFKTNLKELPDWICTLPLKILSASFNKLKKLPSNLDQFETLEELDVSYNNLETLPEKIGSMKNLKYLSINGNSINSLPETIVNLANLKYLEIGSNKFTVFPEVLKNCMRLRSIKIYENDIDSLPEWIGTLHLNEIKISNTKIKELPESMANLKNLGSFDIEGTPLQEGQAFVSSEEAGEVQNFIRLYFSKGSDPVIKYYQEIESGNDERVNKALDELKNNHDLWERVEKKYLSFIQARLNDTNATLYDINKVMLSEQEINMLLRSVGKYFISFHYLHGMESKVIVDFLGSMVKQFVNIDEYINEASLSKDEDAVMSAADKYYKLVKRKILEEAQLYSEGWYSKIYANFARYCISKVRFDHTQFYEANSSLVLKEFYLYLGSFRLTNNITFDIFQSDTPDLTEMFWLMKFVPDTIWGDVSISLPESPLPFKRKCTYKKGDFDEWETF